MTSCFQYVFDSFCYYYYFFNMCFIFFNIFHSFNMCFIPSICVLFLLTDFQEVVRLSEVTNCRTIIVSGRCVFVFVCVFVCVFVFVCVRVVCVCVLCDMT